MPTFSVGQDCQVVFTGPWGQVDLPNGTQFTCEMVSKTLAVDKLTGTTGTRTVFKNWKGDIMFVRGNADLDQMADKMQAAAVAGTAIPDSSILYQISELDGTTTRYQLTKVQIDIKKLADFKADTEAQQSISYMAELRNPA